MTEAIALGWSDLRPVPPGIATHAVDDFQLLSVASGPAPDLLARQQACFEAGLDLLPIHPILACPLSRAARIAPATLRPRWQALRGQAQMVLHLTWPPRARPVSGRTFLAARREEAELQARARCWLERLTTRLGLPATPVESRSQALMVNLLARRDALPDLASLALLTAELQDPAPDCHLTLCGPWPPLAFATWPELT